MAPGQAEIHPSFASKEPLGFRARRAPMFVKPRLRFSVERGGIRWRFPMRSRAAATGSHRPEKQKAKEQRLGHHGKGVEGCLG